MGLFSKELGRNQVQILIHSCPRGEEMQGNASFSVSPNSGPLQTATSTGPPASVAFCISVQKCFLAQVTVAHTAALCLLLLCWPATKGEDC